MMNHITLLINSIKQLQNNLLLRFKKVTGLIISTLATTTKMVLLSLLAAFTKLDPTPNSLNLSTVLYPTVLLDGTLVKLYATPTTPNLHALPTISAQIDSAPAVSLSLPFSSTRPKSIPGSHENLSFLLGSCH